MNIDLKVVKDYKQALQDVYKSAGKEEPLFIVLDPKRHHSKDESFRRPAVGEASMFSATSTALFAADEGLFRPELDLLAIFDARSIRNSNLIRDLVKPGIKSKVLPARGSVALRLLHHNLEFCEGGAHRARKGKTLLHATSVDPLETLYLVAGSERLVNLPSRQRKWVDVPGHNGLRGWANLGLRRDADINQITPETKQLIFSGVPPPANLLHESFGDDPEDEVPQQFVSMCPWEAPEEIFAEVYHCFAHGDKDTIVDMTPGSGLACVAAARANRKYIGFVHSQLHAALIKETVPALVTLFMQLFMQRSEQRQHPVPHPILSK